MFDSRRTARPTVPLPVVLSILVLVALPSAAQYPLTYNPPPRADYITDLSQFLVCKGNPYALCYYSGPAQAPNGNVPALPCVKGDGFATCTCYAVEDAPSINYVALWSILNPGVLRETVVACGVDGEHCLNMSNETGDCETNPKANPDCQTAPVCKYLGTIASEDGTPTSTQILYDEGALISTFATMSATLYGVGTTSCDSGLYAGCMTAPCGPSYPLTLDGTEYTLTDCECPTYRGDYQFGMPKSKIADCPLPEPNIWSAANLSPCP